MHNIGPGLVIQYRATGYEPLSFGRFVFTLAQEYAALVFDDEIVFPPERWAATFRSHAQLILHKLGEYLGYSPPPLLERLIEDAQKIHKQRPILQETLATATQPRCEA